MERVGEFVGCDSVMGGGREGMRKGCVGLRWAEMLDNEECGFEYFGRDHLDFDAVGQ